MWRRVAVTCVILFFVSFATSCARRAPTVPGTTPTEPSGSLPMPEAYGVFVFSEGEYLELQGRIGVDPPVVEVKLPGRLIVYPESGWRTSSKQLKDFTGQKEPYQRNVEVKHKFRPLGNGLYEVLPDAGFQPGGVYGLGIALDGVTQWWYFSFTK